MSILGHTGLRPALNPVTNAIIREGKYTHRGEVHVKIEADMLHPQIKEDEGLPEPEEAERGRTSFFLEPSEGAGPCQSFDSDF